VPFTEFKQYYGDRIPDSLNFDKINARIDKENAAEPNPEKWKDHIEAFTVPSEKPDGYYIYYDDRIRNEPRVRWSIGHEMGHIFVNHFIDFDLRTSNFINISGREIGVLENEAHWFASEVFAPGPFMCILRNKLTAEHISLLCDISIEAATKIGWRIMGRKYDSFPENRQMMLNFSHFIFDGLYWDSVYRVLRERLALHPRLIGAMYEECRVCKSCGAFVHHSSYYYCQYCGEELEKRRQFSMNHMQGIEQPILEGRTHPLFEEGKTWQALFCPKCKNFLYTKDDQFCSVCQTPLYNRCAEQKTHDFKLSLECRRCPDCGGLTTYSKLYDELKGHRIPPPARYKSCLVYEDWGYVRFLLLHNMRNSLGMHLYSVLSDSIAYTDYDNFVLVFSGEMDHAQELLDAIPTIRTYIEDYCFIHAKEIYLYYYSQLDHEVFRIAPNITAIPD